VQASIRIGCSGWSYPDWRGRFYPAELPESAWFGHYAAVFDTVEVNNSFYQLPSAPTVAHWRVQAPAGFLYAVKANRYITHMKKLRQAGRPVQQFLTRMRGLGESLGPILYQLPPHWRCDLARLRDFVALLPADLVHVFEFRDPSWLCDAVFAVLEQSGASLCCHDMSGMAVPRMAVGRVAYVRFHGTGPGYSGSYPEPTLRAWAHWLHEQAMGGRPAFAYFNNDVAARAVVDAQTLRRKVERLARGRTV
jgi:uncharacterized protein YecE (DUF72 family)